MQWIRNNEYSFQLQRYFFSILGIWYYGFNTWHLFIISNEAINRWQAVHSGVDGGIDLVIVDALKALFGLCK